MSSKLPPQYSFESWPLPLREWVARCLSQMSDANRADAQAELRQAIANAFAEKAIWTTDWASVQLQSLMPKAPPTINSLKRKIKGVSATCQTAVVEIGCSLNGGFTSDVIRSKTSWGFGVGA
ncbi:hypothetical protein M405DRAFT_863472 [Rhizopogon salebrosus TDB-379]|nr:hypothetical protein M405DRAFT_863472 [Rhizopogon salebrosus TDB-379]